LKEGENDVEIHDNHDISPHIFFPLGHLYIEKYWMNNRLKPLNEIEIHKIHVFIEMAWYNMHMEMCIFLLRSWLNAALNIYPYGQRSNKELMLSFVFFFSISNNVPTMLSQTFFLICITSRL